MHRRALLLLLIATSCGAEVVPLSARDGGTETPDAGRIVDAGALDPCVLEFSPAELSLGVVDMTRTIRRGVELRNISDVACDVDIHSFGTMLPSSVRLEPGASEVLTLELSADMRDPCVTQIVAFEAVVAGVVQARLHLSWTRPAAVLLVVPNLLDFGGQTPGSRHERDVTIYNTNAGTLSVEGEVRGDTFESTAIDFMMQPGESGTFTVRATAPDAGLAVGEMVLTSTHEVCGKVEMWGSSAPVTIRAEP